MRKRILIIFLALLTPGIPASGQSFMAEFSEFFLWIRGGKKIFSDAKACQRFIERNMTDDKPFKVPPMLSADIMETASGKYRMDVARIHAAEGVDKAAIYLHGGSYISQITGFHWNMLWKISKGSGAALYVPDYPLAPVHSWKEGYILLEALYRQLLKEYEASDIIFMGDSAGGGFALAFAEYIGKKRLPQPGKIIALSPWMDLSMSNPKVPVYEVSDPLLSAYGLVEMGKCWADGLDLRDYRLSPIFGPLDKIDRIYLFVGTREIFYPDVTEFYDRLESAGKDVELYVGFGLNHVFPAYPIPEADEAIGEICMIISE